MHAAHPRIIPSTPYGSPRLPEHRARNKSWSQTSVPPQNIYRNSLIANLILKYELGSKEILEWVENLPSTCPT